MGRGNRGDQDKEAYFRTWPGSDAIFFEDTAGSGAAWQMKRIVLDSSWTVGDTRAHVRRCGDGTGVRKALTPLLRDPSTQQRKQTPSRAEHGLGGRFCLSSG